MESSSEPAIKIYRKRCTPTRLPTGPASFRRAPKANHRPNSVSIIFFLTPLAQSKYFIDHFAMNSRGSTRSRNHAPSRFLQDNPIGSTGNLDELWVAYNCADPNGTIKTYDEFKQYVAASVLHRKEMGSRRGTDWGIGAPFRSSSMKRLTGEM